MRYVDVGTVDSRYSSKPDILLIVWPQ